MGSGTGFSIIRRSFSVPVPMLLAFFVAALFAFLLSTVGCIFVRENASRIGLVDKPGERKIHAAPIPTGGGLGIALGVFGFFTLCQLGLFLTRNFENMASLLPDVVARHLDGAWHRSGSLWILLGLGGILLILGTLDDRFHLSWKLRLAVQTLVAVAAVASGFRLTAFIDLPLVTNALSVLWIVGLINSFNMLDNMNGLSAGIAAICATFLAAVMFLTPTPMSQEPQYFVAGFLIVFVGAIVGFLMHNNPFKASMFMGDGGAYLIGFLLATLTLSATFSGYDQLGQTIYTPLLILAVPLYDTMTVVWIRLRNGKSPFEGDKNHFSHRLVEQGLSTTQAVLTIYLATMVCCLGALLLYQVNFLGATLIFVQTLLMLLLVSIFERTGRRG